MSWVRDLFSGDDTGVNHVVVIGVLGAVALVAFTGLDIWLNHNAFGGISFMTALSGIGGISGAVKAGASRFGSPPVTVAQVTEPSGATAATATSG